MAKVDYARRSDPGQPALELDELKKQALGTAEAPRPDGIDLTISSPDAVGLGGLPHLAEALGRAALEPYAPTPRGLARAREVIARSYASRIQVGRAPSSNRELSPITPDDVFLTASTSESYSILLHLFCDPGDSVLVPRPSYPLLPDLARLADVHVVPYELHFAGGWHLDAASLPSPERIARERIRAVVVVSPNNPTGSFTGPGELEALAALGLPLLVDEVFRPFVHAGGVGRAAASEPLALPGPTILLDGFSKRAALPGLKLGWMVTRGDAEFRREVVQRLDGLLDTFLSVSGPAQSLVPEMLAREEELRRPVQVRCQENLGLLRALLRGSPLTLLEPEAGHSAIVRFPAVRSEMELLREAAERGVWAFPGELFELPLAPCLVVSLLGSPEALERAIRRLLS